MRAPQLPLRARQRRGGARVPPVGLPPAPRQGPDHPQGDRSRPPHPLRQKAHLQGKPQGTCMVRFALDTLYLTGCLNW